MRIIESQTTFIRHTATEYQRKIADQNAKAFFKQLTPAKKAELVKKKIKTDQAPRLIGPRLTLHTAAASHATLAAIAIAAGIVLLLVLPSTYLLFTVFNRPLPEVAK